jgi:hypothetical protein
MNPFIEGEGVWCNDTRDDYVISASKTGGSEPENAGSRTEFVLSIYAGPGIYPQKPLTGASGKSRSQAAAGELRGKIVQWSIGYFQAGEPLFCCIQPHIV